MTIFFLLALLSWALLARRDRRIAALIALSLFGACALFVKQQGGLLLLGGVGFVPLLFSRDRIVALRWVDFLLVPALIGLFTMFFFVLEGGGFLALQRGIAIIGQYGEEEYFRENIQALRTLSPLPQFALLSAVVWVWMCTEVRRLSSRELLLLAILGVSLWAGAGSLYQFTKRGYLHYALLTGPCFALCTALGFSRLCHVVRQTTTGRRIFAIALLSTIPVIVAMQWSHSRALIHYVQALPARPAAEANMAPFQEVCQVVPPHTELFLFPPRRNVIHWMCGTYSSIWHHGYGWPSSEMKAYEETLASARLSLVFVMNRDSEDYNTASTIALRGEKFESMLAAQGFKAWRKMERGVLFRRDVSG